jgi:hypothetical protein
MARLTATLAIFLASTVLVAARANAGELNVRLRFAWGSGGQSPLKWTGKITAAGAKLADLQPLGVEADEAAALRLDGEQILITPLVRRAFDGCDVTIRAEETTPIKIELQGSASSPPKTIEAPLSQLVGAQFRSPLDDFGGYLLINRAPGDVLRIHFDRQHLIFQPGEPFELKLAADLKAEAAKGPIIIDARLIPAEGDAHLWQISKSYDGNSAEPISLQLNVPTAEGAYRLRLVAHHPDGFAGRLVPWEKSAPIATRDVDLVVIDPKQRLPRLTNNWELVSTIDPATTSWWQRLPQWSALDKLPAFSTPRPLGNVKPLTPPNSRLSLVELPLVSTIPDEPSWQAYLLPIRRTGEPYAVEIELPRGVAQHAAVSIIEPDAAGRVLRFGRDAGFFSDAHSEALNASDNPGTITQRLVFWPRTRLPALLIANRSAKNPVQYGKIRLLHRAVEEQPLVATDEDLTAPLKPERLAAAYLGSPDFVKSLGAAEELDPASGLSVATWNTFLQGASRLAQELRAAGYNAAIITVAADGGSLAPINSFDASPRYDTGRLAASGADPLSKDVLEMLLRVFDREGLRLIPAVQLATPLPGLEALKQSAADEQGKAALTWIGADGRALIDRRPADAAVGPYYNILAPQVQTELTAAADQLLERYGRHRALAGLALQLSGAGYGVLPGLASGFDDDTIKRFAADARIELPQTGADRFQKRAALLLGPQLDAWKNWRAGQLTKFYADLSAHVAGNRADLQLVLTTEDLFTGPAEQRLRQAVSGRGALDDAAKELGLDLRQLAAAPNVTLLRARRLNADESINERALDLRLNAAAELDRALAPTPRSGDLLYYTSTRLRLPSFDAQGPFGADRTYLALSSPSFPLDDAALEPLATALAGRDFTTLASGAELLPLAENNVQTAAFRTFRELPLAAADVQIERQAPVTIRIYRERESTTVCLINESPWPADVALPLQCDANIVWRQLGVEPAASNPKPTPTNPADATTGSLTAGPQKWSTTLPSYGIQARRFSSPTMQVGAFTPQVAQEAKTDLARRVAALEERMPNLNVERAYEQLKNPSFELAGENGRLLGWQPRVGSAGSVDIAVEPPPETGGPAQHCAHLRSEDALGVAVQSQLFPIPATGQLLIRAKVRADHAQPNVRLYAWVEYQQAGVMQPARPTLLGAAETFTKDWKEVQFPLDELPMASNGQMRLQFHLAGVGEVWVDDIRLYDLCFSGGQRIELAKRLYAAKTALEEGQLLDCQHLVEGYWPRRLVEQVPAAAIASRPAEPAESEAAAEEATQKSLGARVRGIVPKILR